MILLRKEKPMIHIPANDDEYFRWIEANPTGFIVNSDKALSNSKLPMIHTTNCTHVNDQDWPGYTSSDRFKLCSTDRDELARWVKEIDGRDLKICKTCTS